MSRRLYRSTDDRRIGGVCGGLGEYFGVDPNILRLGFIVAATVGVGIIAYLLMWIIFPEGDNTSGAVTSTEGRKRTVDTNIILGGILLLAALIIGFSDPFDDTVLVPLALVGGGIWLLTQRPIATDDDNSTAVDGSSHPEPPPPDADPQPAPSSSPPPLSPGEPGSADPSAAFAPHGAVLTTGVGSDVDAAIDTDGADDLTTAAVPPGDAPERAEPDRTEVIARIEPDEIGFEADPDSTEELEPDQPVADFSELPPPPAWPPPPDTASQPTPAPKTAKPAYVTRIVLSLGALVIAGAIAVAQTDLWDITITQVIGALLGLIGLGLVVGAIWGGARGLLPLGIVAAVALIPAVGIDAVIDDGVGEREYVVLTVDDLEESYRLGIGRLEVDLSQLDLEGASHRIEVELGIGEVVVIVPDDATILATADVGAGKAEVFDRVEDGLGNDIGPLRFEGDNGELIVDVEVGMGHGVVEAARPSVIFEPLGD